jgi:hypothetical protein
MSDNLNSRFYRVGKYWKHILFFGLYFAILMICKSPDITAKVYGNDSFSLLAMARLFVQRYPSTVYAILGYPFANWFPGSDGGNLVLYLSVIPAFLTSIVVFLTVKKMVKDELAPWVASAVLMGCYIFFCQAVIVEVFTIMAFFVSLSYLFIVYDKPKLACFFLGLCISSHYLTGIIPFIIFFVAYKEIRKNCYIAILTILCICVPYYLLVPYSYWMPGDGSKLMSLFTSTFICFVSGSPSNIGAGIVETIRVIVVGFGLSLIPIYFAVRKDWKRICPIFILFIIPIVWKTINDYFLGFHDLPVFIPFGAILAGVGVCYIDSKIVRYSILVFSIGCLLFAPVFFNMGSSIDTNPTTDRQMITALDNVSNGSIIIDVKLFKNDGFYVSDELGGHIATIVDYHNAVYGSKLIPFDLETIFENVTSSEREKLVAAGVNIPNISDDFNYSTGNNSEEQIAYCNMIDSVSRSNPNSSVYYYICTNERNEEYDLVVWK